MDTAPTAPLLPTGPAPSVGDEGVAASAAAADFDSFLNLLTAQLKYQDPLQPLDSTQFVAQLASFSTVEQLIGANERLETLIAQGEAEDIAALTGWLGTEVSATDGSFRSTGGEIELFVPAKTTATSATASILSLQGTVLHTFPVNPAGGMAVWDGRDQSGKVVPPADLRAVVDYSEGGESIGSLPATIYRGVVGLVGGEISPNLELSDGGKLEPRLVSSIRTPNLQDD